MCTLDLWFDSQHSFSYKKIMKFLKVMRHADVGDTKELDKVIHILTF